MYIVYHNSLIFGWRYKVVNDEIYHDTDYRDVSRWIVPGTLED